MTQLDALAAWPAWGRAVVVLPYWEDLSVQKVADVPGCSPGNVTSRNARDLDRLRAVLGEARTGSGSLSVWPEDQREAGGTSDG
jgi:DNA-directed RNA polymerase specialized sigma24 family protein